MSTNRSPWAVPETGKYNPTAIISLLGLTLVNITDVTLSQIHILHLVLRNPEMMVFFFADINPYLTYGTKLHMHNRG